MERTGLILFIGGSVMAMDQVRRWLLGVDRAPVKGCVGLIGSLYWTVRVGFERIYPFTE